MTRPALMLIQLGFVRIACARRTGQDLRGLRHSLEQACGLPPGETWDGRAAAHAEFYRLLAEATGAPEFARLAGFIGGSLQGMIAAAGPAAEALIIASHRRLLGCLEARDADAAARVMENHLARLGQASPRLVHTR